MTKNLLRAIAAGALATLGQVAFALTYSADFGTELSDGGGKYDVIFSLPTSASDRWFGAGEPTSYTIAASGATAANFNFKSSPGGGNGTGYSAIRVLNTGGDSGGFTGATVPPIPKPGNYALILAGLVVVGFIARRRTRRA